jgi:hypothetical protein
MDLWPQMKRTWFHTQIKQDIAISTQLEHERHSTHKRGSYSIFTKGSHPQAYYPKATKSTTIHLMSITSKVIISYLAYHGDQRIWEKHISMTYDTNAVYDTKMQTCKHDMIHKWKCNMPMYINPPNKSSKGKNNSKLSLQTRKCSLVQGLC